MSSSLHYNRLPEEEFASQYIKWVIMNFPGLAGLNIAIPEKPKLFCSQVSSLETETHIYTLNESRFGYLDFQDLRSFKL